MNIESFFKIQYQQFFETLDHHEELKPLHNMLPARLEQGLDTKRYGDIPKWLTALEQLPDLHVEHVNLNNSAIHVSGETLTEAEQQTFIETLKKLMPWRKGPFHLFGTDINTEWRSDWKWDRLKNQIAPLKGRKILDVGCGSGYHCWRMRGEEAELVIGIDPSPLFIMQYLTLQKYIQDYQVTVLPMGIEHLPEKLEAFDTVFSMGVLYHRRSPIDHLYELKNSLRAGGELVIETIIVDGKEGYSLMPEGRYAKMGNVWFIPSTKTLISWLNKVGFKHIKVIDESVTSLEEQRSTDWMVFHSLKEFLNPDDSSKTIEGYPAPKRVVITAQKP